MPGKKVLIFVFMVAVLMPTFNCTSIQKKYSPLLFPNKFWHSRELPEKNEETSYDAKKSGLMAVDLKEPIVRNSNFEGNTRDCLQKFTTYILVHNSKVVNLTMKMQAKGQDDFSKSLKGGIVLLSNLRYNKK